MLAREQFRELRRQLQAELTAIGEKLGWSLDLGGGSYGEYVRFKLECTPKVAGQVVDRHEQEFKALAGQYFLKGEDYGQTFTRGGRVFKICGLAPKASRYPILAKRMDTGGVFKFEAAVVARALGRPVPERAIVHGNEWEAIQNSFGGTT